MKGYYKNWYQHYLELEEKKEIEARRGYYSDFVVPEKGAENQMPESRKGFNHKYPNVQSAKKEKKRSTRLGALLPVATILGFIFLWYQMDAGPVRHLVNEALVFARVREVAVDVISYHTNLLDQHIEFAEKVSAYINREGELSFDDLESLYDEIRATYTQVVEVSDEEHKEVIRLWSHKMSSTGKMMNDLIIDDDDIIAAHAQFVIEQEELAALIRQELMLEEDT